MLGFGLQLFVVYPLLLIVAGRRRPREFFRQISEVMLMAFGTSSSNATLPVAMRVAEERLHLPPAVSRFVLTVGATGNQNGTALYEGVVVLFLAQVFGVDLNPYAVAIARFRLLIAALKASETISRKPMPRSNALRK